MSFYYTVRPGDYLSKIAHAHGFSDWRVIYDHPENEAFRRLRPDPNLIMPGDRVFIPEHDPHAMPAQTCQHARFRTQHPDDYLELVLKDDQGEALRHTPYQLTVGGQVRPGVTDGQGKLRQQIPAGAASAVLSILGCRLDLRIGELLSMNDAPDEGLLGVKQRLCNLAYHPGPADDVLDDATRDAIRRFEREHELPALSDISGMLKQRLRTVYGC